MPLKHSTFRWFEALSCKTASVGQLLVCNLHHLNYSMQRTKIADSLLLGTLSGVRDQKYETFNYVRSQFVYSYFLFKCQSSKTNWRCYYNEPQPQKPLKPALHL